MLAACAQAASTRRKRLTTHWRTCLLPTFNPLQATHNSQRRTAHLTSTSTHSAYPNSSQNRRRAPTCRWDSMWSRPHRRRSAGRKYSMWRSYASKILESAGQRIGVLLPFNVGQYYEECLVDVGALTARGFGAPLMSLPRRTGRWRPSRPLAARPLRDADLPAQKIGSSNSQRTRAVVLCYFCVQYLFANYPQQKGL